MLPTGTLNASVDPEASNAKLGELVITPTLSLPASTNKPCVLPFDSTLKSTSADASLNTTELEAAVVIVKLPVALAMAVFAPSCAIVKSSPAPTAKLVLSALTFNVLLVSNVVNLPLEAVVAPTVALSIAPPLMSTVSDLNVPIASTTPVPAASKTKLSFDLDDTTLLSSMATPCVDTLLNVASFAWMSA